MLLFLYRLNKGLEQLLQTIAKVRRQINPNLIINGILMTMVDNRTNDAKDIISTIRESYGDKLHIFGQNIPLSVHAKESSREGISIFSYEPDGKVATAYESLTKEVLENGENRNQSHAS